MFVLAKNVMNSCEVSQQNGAWNNSFDNVLTWKLVSGSLVVRDVHVVMIASRIQRIHNALLYKCYRNEYRNSHTELLTAPSFE